jgi:methionyl aminopeptidase
MIRLKSVEEIARIGEAGQVLADAMRHVARMIRPGVQTAELDRETRRFIESRGGRPSFLGYLDFPASACISLNEQVIHGIPGSRRVQAGDMVKLDLGVELHGFFADAAWTFGAGEVSGPRRRLMAVTRECLEIAVTNARPGARVHDVGRAVQAHAERHGYGVVRQFCGHGVGFAQHEDPQVPNYASRGPNPRLKPGMVIALEPMINQGTWEVEVLEDGWTVRTLDGSDSAHYEYTVAIVDGGAEILTPIGDL